MNILYSIKKYCVHLYYYYCDVADSVEHWGLILLDFSTFTPEPSNENCQY